MPQVLVRKYLSNIGDVITQKVDVQVINQGLYKVRRTLKPYRIMKQIYIDQTNNKLLKNIRKEKIYHASILLNINIDKDAIQQNKNQMGNQFFKSFWKTKEQAKAVLIIGVDLSVKLDRGNCNSYQSLKQVFSDCSQNFIKTNH